MISDNQQKYARGAIDNIQDAIAGLRTIKVALGMTEESHIETDLKAAINRIETMLEE